MQRRKQAAPRLHPREGAAEPAPGVWQQRSARRQQRPAGMPPLPRGIGHVGTGGGAGGAAHAAGAARGSLAEQRRRVAQAPIARAGVLLFRALVPGQLVLCGRGRGRERDCNLPCAGGDAGQRVAPQEGEAGEQLAGDGPTECGAPTGGRGGGREPGSVGGGGAREADGRGRHGEVFPAAARCRARPLRNGRARAQPPLGITVCRSGGLTEVTAAAAVCFRPPRGLGLLRRRRRGGGERRTDPCGVGRKRGCARATLDVGSSRSAESGMVARALANEQPPSPAALQTTSPPTGIGAAAIALLKDQPARLAAALPSGIVHGTGRASFQGGWGPGWRRNRPPAAAEPQAGTGPPPSVSVRPGPPPPSADVGAAWPGSSTAARRCRRTCGSAGRHAKPDQHDEIVLSADGTVLPPWPSPPAPPRAIRAPPPAPPAGIAAPARARADIMDCSLSAPARFIDSLKRTHNTASSPHSCARTSADPSRDALSADTPITVRARSGGRRAGSAARRGGRIRGSRRVGFFCLRGTAVSSCPPGGAVHRAVIAFSAAARTTGSGRDSSCASNRGSSTACACACAAGLPSTARPAHTHTQNRTPPSDPEGADGGGGGGAGTGLPRPHEPSRPSLFPAAPSGGSAAAPELPLLSAQLPLFSCRPSGRDNIPGPADSRLLRPQALTPPPGSSPARLGLSLLLSAGVLPPAAP
eukprot:scaffold3745_cov79-Isochrysis_galbana.AAC.2